MLEIKHKFKPTITSYENTRKIYFGPYTVMVIDHPDEDPYTELTILVEDCWGDGKSTSKTVVAFVFYPNHFGEKDLCKLLRSTQYSVLMLDPDLKDWRNSKKRLKVMAMVGVNILEQIHHEMASDFGLWHQDLDLLEEMV